MTQLHNSTRPLKMRGQRPRDVFLFACSRWASLPCISCVQGIALRSSKPRPRSGRGQKSITSEAPASPLLRHCNLTLHTGNVCRQWQRSWGCPRASLLRKSLRSGGHLCLACSMQDAVNRHRNGNDAEFVSYLTCREEDSHNGCTRRDSGDHRAVHLCF
jgi:hypothetical protein